jgi:hypothetical protein
MCLADLRFEGEGWWSCPRCQYAFFAEVADSDFEDYHCFLEDRIDGTSPPEKPRYTYQVIDLRSDEAKLEARVKALEESRKRMETSLAKLYKDLQTWREGE